MFSAFRAGPLFATQLTLSLDQAVRVCVSIYESLGFKTTNFFPLTSRRDSHFLFVVDALLDCETWESAHSRIGYDCETTSCNPPQFKACYEPKKSGKYYVRNSQKPLHVETMKSFKVRSVRNVAFAYAGSLPRYFDPNSAPDAICELKGSKAFCGSCSRLPP
ncbi:hypothetical protein O181_076498 [Austropuccinia psidii MF-1]|uniref:Uncharacterized protein n=1 Tax=Austropuccinia psidii MF-1 TaxID=1389203 RepID=A0A9Q3ICU5_9BASI|nr:hypothetical protein [Austropuccinia psidii MF-1]